MLNRLVEITLQATQAEVGLLLQREGSQGDLQVIAAQSNPPLEAQPRVVGPGDERLAPVMAQGGAVRVRAEAEEGIEILVEIPDDRKVAEAYARGDIAVHVLPKYRELFQGLLDKVMDRARQSAA
jgi:hypothetical protein